LYRHRDGSYVWLEWTSRPDADAKELIAVARDVTARKTAEETVRRYHELLEREVGERTRDLEGARLEILRRLALAAEYLDDETFEHTERVARTAAALTDLLGLPKREVNLMRDRAPSPLDGRGRCSRAREPATRGRLTARPALRRARIAEVREGGDAVACAVSR
jgi:hypothetical protein